MQLWVCLCTPLASPFLNGFLKNNFLFKQISGLLIKSFGQDWVKNTVFCSMAREMPPKAAVYVSFLLKIQKGVGSLFK